MNLPISCHVNYLFICILIIIVFKKTFPSVSYDDIINILILIYTHTGQKYPDTCEITKLIG